MKAKKLVAILSVVLAFCLIFSACLPFEDIFGFDIVIDQGEGGGKTDGGTVDGKQTYNVEKTGTVPSYGEINTSNVVEAVAEVNMPSVYEVTCTIVFSYRVRYLIGFFSDYQFRTETAQQTGQGTAFAINEDGYLVTNAHVICVENSASYSEFKYLSREIYVNLADESEAVPCEIVAYNEQIDLAVLKIKDEGVSSEGREYTLGDVQHVVFFKHDDPTSENHSTGLRYGETVVAIGNANGYGISVTSGVVSAPLRQFLNNDDSVTKAIQTDAAINPGNSGGPLCNGFCAVIGVNSFKIVQNATESMGYAIPSYVVLNFIESLNSTPVAGTVDGNCQALTNKVNVHYYYTTERSYASDGSNVTMH